MPIDKVEKVRRHLAALEERARERHEPDGVLTEAFEDLHTMLEELQAAKEQLTEQNVQLASAAQDLEVERLRYIDLFERAPNGYVVTDLRGMILEVNHVAATMLRPGAGSPKGKPIISYVADEDRRDVRTRLQRLKKAGRENWELRLQPLQGPQINVAASVAAVDGRPGKSVLHWIVQDITERKHLEDEARQHRAELTHALRVSTIGEVAAGLAHELNQPLSAITNYAKGCALRLRAGRSDVSELHEVMDQIAVHAARAANIVRHLRDFISKDQITPKIGDVNVIVQEAARLVEPESSRRGIALELVLGSALGPIKGDLIQIEQVVLNLVMNAVEALNRQEIDQRVITIETSSSGDSDVRVTVRDTGAGIPSADSDKIYDAFFTTKPGGLGLGLSMSRSIVEAHGGRLWRTPNDGPGTSFHFTLPLAGNGRDHAD